VTTAAPTQQATLEEYLDYEKFMEWLQSKQPDDIVGSTRDASHCPVATYLRETGSFYAQVTLRHAYVRNDKLETIDKVPLPGQFRQVVEATDYNTGLDTPVTAQQLRSKLEVAHEVR
jgi:hypothetical protein